MPLQPENRSPSVAPVRSLREATVLFEQLTARIADLERQVQSQVATFGRPPVQGSSLPVIDPGTLDDVPDGTTRKLTAAMSHILSLWPDLTIDFPNNSLDFNNTPSGASPFGTHLSVVPVTGNIKLALTAFLPAGDWMGVYFFDASNNGYRISVGGTGADGAVIIDKFTAAGAFTRITQTATTPRFDNGTHTLTVQIHGDTGHFIIHVDGTRELALVDATYVINNAVGLAVSNGGTVLLKKAALHAHDAIKHTAHTGGVPNKPILHLFPNAVMDVDGKRIDLPMNASQFLSTPAYLNSANPYTGSIEIGAHIEGKVEWFLPSSTSPVESVGYYFDMDTAGGTMSITQRVVGGALTTLVSGTFTGAAGAMGILIRFHSLNNKLQLHVGGVVLKATGSTIAPNGVVCVDGYGTGQSYLSHCTIKGHSAIHPDNQDTNGKAVIDFSQPYSETGTVNQHVKKRLQYIDDDFVAGSPGFQRQTGIVHHDIMVDNGNFEAGSLIAQNGSSVPTPAGWGTFGIVNSVSYETVSPYEGLQSIIVNAANSTSGIGPNKVINIAPNDIVKFGGAMFGDGTNAAQIDITFWDKNFTPLSVVTLSNTAAAWSFQTTTATAPANTVFAGLHLHPNAAATVKFDKIICRLAKSTDELVPNAVTSSAEDRETGAHALSVGNFTVVARIASYTAFAANDHLRFDIQANISLTNFTFDNSVNQKDSLQWELVEDDGNAVGSNITGGTVISGPHPVSPGLNNQTAGTCSPGISIVGKPPKFVVPDANAHSYSLAVKLVNGGAGTVSGTTVLGSTVIPSAVIELHELKR